ncbi:MAG: aldolase/citrate lyase family protein [Pseudomonadales bacterium]
MSRHLRERLRRGDLLVGTWVKTPHPMICEALGHSQLDVLCLDAEHSPFDRGAINDCLLATRAASMPALVRTPSAAPEHILNALDCGATGVVVPHVDSAEMAAAIARAAHYGAGGRGYAGSSRAAGYGTKRMASHLGDSAQETTVVAQIEDLEALEVIDDIAAVDAVDCLFIGRIDLTVALGADSPADAAVLNAVEQICLAGRKAGRAVGMFVSDMEEIPRWRSVGASLFLLASDHALMLQSANGLAQRVRDSE